MERLFREYGMESNGSNLVKLLAEERSTKLHTNERGYLFSLSDRQSNRRYMRNVKSFDGHGSPPRYFHFRGFLPKALKSKSVSVPWTLRINCFDSRGMVLCPVYKMLLRQGKTRLVDFLEPKVLVCLTLVYVTRLPDGS